MFVLLVITNVLVFFPRIEPWICASANLSGSLRLSLPSWDSRPRRSCLERRRIFFRRFLRWSPASFSNAGSLGTVCWNRETTRIWPKNNIASSKAPMKIAPWFLTEGCGSQNPDHAFRNACADRSRILRKATFFGD
jgi:hypothetical protein